MVDFRTTLPPKIADLLAKYPSAKRARLTAQVDVDGGTATSVNLNMTASGTEDGTQTSLSARLDAEGTTISATRDTASETASTSLELSARLQEKLAVAQVIAAAEAKGDGADTTATASTS